jgi:hypothetical protein
MDKEFEVTIQQQTHNFLVSRLVYGLVTIIGIICMSSYGCERIKLDERAIRYEEAAALRAKSDSDKVMWETISKAREQELRHESVLKP